MRPKAGERYLHRKGTIYTVVALARESESLREVVVYTDGGGNVWVRGLRRGRAPWVGEVYVQGEGMRPRFELINPTTKDVEN